jgi:2-oxoisovalerate dehydrogenase E1 component alpha subunit
MTTVATFTIEYTRFLDPQGKLVQALPAFAENPKTLVELYRLMAKLRVFDTKAIALQRTGKMGTYASTLGQEAVSVGIGHSMRADDALCPAYREYGAQFQRGVKMQDIFAYWGGDERGSNFANPNDFPISVPIGTQGLHAAGIATAFKLRKQPRVAVTVCGDGATSQGDFYEAMNVSGTWKLPVVFVVNNNQWAISVPRGKQTATETLAQKAIAAGFTGEQVDGNDVIAMCYAMERALEKARRGEGPTLIEAITYRLCDHTTADDANRYRSKEDLEKARKDEPLVRLRIYLTEQGLWSDADEQRLIEETSKEVEAAVQEYINVTPQPPEAMFDYMYAKLPHDLKVQREIAKAYAIHHHEGH